MMSLDLSLTSAGVYVVDFRGNRLFSVSHGWSIHGPSKSKKKVTLIDRRYDALQQVSRLASIVNLIVEVAAQFDVKTILVENYAFSKDSSSVTKLAEIGGAVKTALFTAIGRTTIPISVMSVRASVLGAGHGRCKKEAVKGILSGMGMNFENDDIMDAFMLCMYGMVEIYEV